MRNEVSTLFVTVKICKPIILYDNHHNNPVPFTSVELDCYYITLADLCSDTHFTLHGKIITSSPTISFRFLPQAD